MPDERQRMTRVEVGDAVLYVEATPVRAADGWSPEGTDELERPGFAPDLSGVTDALASFAGQLSQALHRAAPDRATVEFGCEVAVESGRLTALIVQGSARANLRVTLEWVKGGA